MGIWNQTRDRSVSIDENVISVVTFKLYS